MKTIKTREHMCYFNKKFNKNNEKTLKYLLFYQKNQ